MEHSKKQDREEGESRPGRTWYSSTTDIFLPGTTLISTSYIAAKGPSTPLQIVEVYVQAREQMFLYSGQLNMRRVASYDNGAICETIAVQNWLLTISSCIQTHQRCNL